MINSGYIIRELINSRSGKYEHLTVPGIELETRLFETRKEAENYVVENLNFDQHQYVILYSLWCEK